MGTKVLKTVMATAALTLFALTAAAQPIALSDDFETTYDGWAERGDFTKLTALGEAGYNSPRGMKVTGRRAASDGAVSEKGFYLDGGETYAYSVFVKHAGNAPETFNLTLRWLFPDGKTYGSEVIASAAVPPNQWTELAAKYAAPKTTVNLTLSITTNGTVDFCFDKVTVAGNSILRKSAKAMAGEGLKDVYANYFRVGNILNGTTVNNSGIKALILKEYNSISMENEMKPDATVRQSGSTNENILAQINTSAAAILKFCVDNNIAVRGHVLVWHGQSPRWFFTSNLQNPADPGNTNSVSWASKAVMEKRLETYITNMFKLIKEQYPNLNLYAYDVVNEAVGTCNNVLGARCPGYDFKGAGGVDQTAEGNSPWTKIYGDNSFIESAFKYAKAARDQYFPNCKLFYNDYNEWDPPKRDHIISQILTPLKNKGYLDGMGMQGHIDANTGGWSSVERCTTAMNMYAALNIDVQITELDIGMKGYTAQQQADRYKGVFQHAVKVNKKGGGKFTAIVIWGPNDGNSWRGDDNATIHDASNNPKAAYSSIFSVVPQSEWGDGNNPGGGGSVVTPDANGYYFHHTYEDGTAQGWTNHFGGSVANTNAQKANGSRSLAVTGRTGTYQGAEYSLSTNPFAPGSAFSFSAIAMYNTGGERDTFKLTLQFDSASGGTGYAQVAVAEANRGSWVMLENRNFTIPAGASNLLLYVEMPNNETGSFFIDDAMGGVAGTNAPGRGGVTSIGGQSIVSGNTHIQPLMTISGRTLNITGVDSKVQIRVVNMAGKSVASFNAKGDAKLSLKKIPAGAYIVEARRIKDGYKMTLAITLR